MNGTDGFQWRERRWYTTCAPEGKCWSVREMLSYGTDLDVFISHLQAMAEGLERAHFSEYDGDGDGDSEDSYGMFVVGLRPMTPADKTRAQVDAEWQERNEREQYERLKAKFEPGRKPTDPKEVN